MSEVIDTYILQLKELRAAGKHDEAHKLKTCMYRQSYSAKEPNMQQLTKCTYKDIAQRVLPAYREFDVKIIKDAYMNESQAKLNSMAIATLLDIINNIKEGRENVVEFDVKNHIERIMDNHGSRERLEHTGRRFTLELR